jgi:hypothetical protein|tara:strand:- start:511 stop:720 length:210 start_codon:yes stop_codon:yes gene_type:complete
MEVLKCYKQICIALAIKKVRLHRSANVAVQKIFIETVKTVKESNFTNARNVGFALFGVVTCQTDDSLAT